LPATSGGSHIGAIRRTRSGPLEEIWMVWWLAWLELDKTKGQSDFS
jgi:hypothetical protein